METGDGDNNQHDDEDTDSVESQPGQGNNKRRKHCKLRPDLNSANKRAHASREGSSSQDGTSQEHNEKSTGNRETSPRAAAIPVGPAVASALDSSDSDSESTSSDDSDHVNRTDDDAPEPRERESDVMLTTPPTDAKLLIEPLRAVPFYLALPGLLLTREFSGLTTYASPALTRQKLAGHRDMVQRLELWAKLEHHTGCVNALNFNPSGTVLLSGSDDLNVDMWDWSGKKLKYSFESGHVANVFQCKFMPLSNDSLIVTASRDGSVRLAELSTAGGPPAIRTLCRHQRECHKIDVRPDATHQILTCGEDGAVFHVDIREARSRKCLTVYSDKSMDSHKVPVYSIMSNPHNAVEFVLGCEDRFARVYDLRKLNANWKDDDQGVLKFCPPIIRGSSFKSFHVTSAVYNHNGSEILASYNDHNIFRFKNESNPDSAPIQQYEGHRNRQTVKGVNFYGPRSEFVVSGSDCGTVFFWDTLTGRIVHYLTADEIGAVNVLEPHPTDPVFATSGLEHSVKVWAPIAESRPDLSPLIPIIQKNQREQLRQYRHPFMPEPDMDHFFMMLLRHVARRRELAPRPNANGHAQPPPIEESSSDDSGPDDGPPPHPSGLNCGTS